MSSESITQQDACGCCEGVSVQSPVGLYNRPGLKAIAYRIGTHSTVLASLLARLSSQDYPGPAKLRTRDRDDYSIALLDAYACMADVLGFYQERIANESYLRTASERLSMSELARLIGYRLKPGVAAETYLAFTMEEPPLQAASSTPKQASGVPDKVMLPIGVKVQSLPGPDEKPQTFETVESVEARPAWNALKPRLTQSYLPASGHTDLYVQGANLALKPGDGLLFIGNEFISGADKSRWQFRLLTTVTLDTNQQRTRVTWDQALTASTPGQNPQVHVLRKRAAVFGHNAPMWLTMPTAFKVRYPGYTAAATDWPDYKISAVTDAVDLDAVYADIVPHGTERSSWLVLTGGSSSSPFKVTAVREVSRAAFGMSAKVTRATLSGDNYATFESKVRETAVYAVSEQLHFAEAPNAAPVSGDHVTLDHQVEGLLPKRKLIVTGRVQNGGGEQIEVVTLKSVTPEGSVSRLTFQENLAHSYQRDTVVIHANIALATHGETVYQILGSGAARQSHQHFNLKHAPLTHVGAENETGAEAALEVRVNDILWHETPTLYDAGAGDHFYVLRVGEDGAGAIQFGDGKRGARLPTGQENVHAVYRKGIGAAGNVHPGQLSQLLTRPLGLKAVSNPLAAEGGVDADDTDNARRNMPLGVRTLGHVVSLQDYEDYARAYSGIAKAQARVLNTRSGRTVFVTVAGDDGVQPTVGGPTLTKLLNALRLNGDPLVRCDAAPYVKATFKLALRIKRHPDHDTDVVLKAVEAAVRAAFSFDARDFGQTVARSEVISVAQRVTGVLAVDVDRFYRGAIDLKDRLAPASATVNSAGNVIAAELLLLDEGALDYVEEMP